MRILVATVQVPFVQGGAEVLAADLLKALAAEGHEAEMVAIPFKSGPPEAVLDQMLACRLFDLASFNDKEVDRLITLKFPAYLMRHPRKVMWLVHQHRLAYDLYDHPLWGLNNEPKGAVVRDAIRAADRQLISESSAIYTISENVTRRLRHYNGIDSLPLHPPVAEAGKYHCAESIEDYLFFPSRVAPLKRQELVIQALALTQEKVQVCFAGLPDSKPYGEDLKRKAEKLAVAQRIKWLGRLTDQEMRDTYARALAVVFPPLDEDYGYITLEAMLSSKAVVTCRDSGGPLEFLQHDHNGLVVEPEPEAMAAAFDQLWKSRALAAQLGREGRRTYDRLGLSWSKVVTTLLA